MARRAVVVAAAGGCARAAAAGQPRRAAGSPLCHVPVCRRGSRLSRGARPWRAPARVRARGRRRADPRRAAAPPRRRRATVAARRLRPRERAGDRAAGSAVHRRPRRQVRHPQPEGDVAPRAGPRARPARRVDGLRGGGRGLLRAVRRDAPRAERGDRASGPNSRCSTPTSTARCRAPTSRSSSRRSPLSCARSPRDLARPTRRAASPRSCGWRGRSGRTSTWTWRTSTAARPCSWRSRRCLRATSSGRRPRSGWCLQAYLRDADETLDRILSSPGLTGREVPPTIRLVKGAYWDRERAIAGQRGLGGARVEREAETPTPASSGSRAGSSTPPIGSPGDRHAQPPVAGPRDRLPWSSAEASRVELELQVLRGLGDELAEGVARLGYRVRIYTPIGDLVAGMAYLVRRLLENSSNQGFLLQQRHHSLERPPQGARVKPTDKFNLSRASPSRGPRRAG